MARLGIKHGALLALALVALVHHTVAVQAQGRVPLAQLVGLDEDTVLREFGVPEGIVATHANATWNYRLEGDPAGVGRLYFHAGVLVNFDEKLLPGPQAPGEGAYCGQRLPELLGRLRRPATFSPHAGGSTGHARLGWAQPKLEVDVGDGRVLAVMPGR